MRNLQEQVKKAFCYQKLFWPFTVWINCFSHLKNFANSRPSASNFKSFYRSLEQFFLTAVGQNNIGNKYNLWFHIFFTQTLFWYKGNDTAFGISFSSFPSWWWTWITPLLPQSGLDLRTFYMSIITIMKYLQRNILLQTIPVTTPITISKTKTNQSTSLKR